jgi:hypothetical protein
MTTPTPGEGETSRDPQSETVAAPHADPDPPRRTKTAAVSGGLLLAMWLVLGVALVALAVSLLV